MIAAKIFRLGGVKIDLLDQASRANAVLGIRDSGKTVTAKVMAEADMRGGVPIVVFDPTGVWRFLRVPGAGTGYEVVVIGGDDGDFPLSEYERVLRAALDTSVSIVINLKGRHIPKAEWMRTVVGGIGILMDGNKGLRHVVIEEAAEFAPQIVRGGNARVYEAVESLVRTGGNYGLGVTLINQRPQELNKAVLEQCDNLFLHRQKGKHALKYLGDWFAHADVDPARIKEIEDSEVAKMGTGQCWVWLREKDPVRVTVQMCTSFHPNRRQMIGAEKIEGQPVDVSRFVTALKAAIAAEVEEAKPKAVGLVHATGMRPGASLRAAAAADAAALKQATDAAYAAGRAAAQRQAGIDARKIADHVEKGAAGLGAALGFINKAWDALADVINDAKVGPLTAPHAGAILSPASNGARPASSPARQADPGAGGSANNPGNLTKPQLKCLEAVAWWCAAGISEPEADQVAVVAGWRPGGSNISDRLSELTKLGLVHRPAPRLVRITAAGIEVAPTIPTIVGGQVAEYVRRILTDPQKRVFDALMEAPSGVDVIADSVADRLGWAVGGSNISDRLSELSRLRIVERPRPKHVKIVDWVRG